MGIYRRVVSLPNFMRGRSIRLKSVTLSVVTVFLWHSIGSCSSCGWNPPNNVDLKSSLDVLHHLQELCGKKSSCHRWSHQRPRRPRFECRQIKVCNCFRANSVVCHTHWTNTKLKTLAPFKSSHIGWQIVFKSQARKIVLTFYFKKKF